MPSTADLIRDAVERIQAYRVEVPGPTIAKGFGEDERVHVSLPRSHFNELATKGGLGDWREAYELGQVKVEGDPGVRKLIGTVIERQLARARLKRAR